MAGLPSIGSGSFVNNISRSSAPNPVQAGGSPYIYRQAYGGYGVNSAPAQTPQNVTPGITTLGSSGSGVGSYGTPSYSSSGSGSGGSSGSGGGSSAPASNPGLNAFIQASDIGINSLQNQLGMIPTQQNQTIADLNNAYTPQFNTLADQQQEGLSADQKAQNTLNESRSNSLRDLGIQMRQLLNSYNGVLAASGAGSSSAAPVLEHLLMQQYNNATHDIGQNYGTQQTGINQDISNINTNYNDQLGNLQAAKKQAYDNIVNQYLSTKQNIMNAINSAGTDQARTALYMQDQAAANQALTQLQQMEGQFGNLQSQLESTYKSTMPQASISQYTNGYTVQPWSAQSVAPVLYNTNAAPQMTTSGAPVSALMPGAAQQNQNAPVGTIQSLHG